MSFDKINKVSEQELTPALQDKINAKAEQAAFLAHTGNTVIHTSQEEKDSWNAMLGTSKSYTDSKLAQLLGSIDATNNVKALLDTKLNTADFNTFKSTIKQIAYTASYNDLDPTTLPKEVSYSDKANSAIHADSATNATNANYATNAGNATTADNALKVGGIRITIGGSAPVNPVNNAELWWDTSNSRIMTYVGNGWQQTKGIWY